jgi:hypothetical protein
VSLRSRLSFRAGGSGSTRTHVRVPITVPERIAIVLISIALSLGLIAVLSGFFAGRDQPGVSGSTVPGQAFPDQGHAHLKPGEPHPPYSSNPPTSGPHVPQPVLRDDAQLNDDQLLQALEVGNVVLMYGGRTPPAGLEQLARSVSYAFTPAVAAAGQAVILARRPGTTGVIGLAWAHMISVAGPSDPALRQFAAFWLGHGAPGHRTR